MNNEEKPTAPTVQPEPVDEAHAILGDADPRFNHIPYNPTPATATSNDGPSREASCPKCFRPLNLGNSQNLEECHAGDDDEDGQCALSAQIHALRQRLARYEGGTVPQVLSDTRPHTPSEQQAVDKFFISQFKGGTEGRGETPRTDYAVASCSIPVPRPLQLMSEMIECELAESNADADKWCKKANERYNELATLKQAHVDTLAKLEEANKDKFIVEEKLRIERAYSHAQTGRLTAAEQQVKELTRVVQDCATLIVQKDAALAAQTAPTKREEDYPPTNTRGEIGEPS